LKQDSAKQIKLGMILSYINLGIGNLIPFFYTPIMLELLGQSEYGLYKIAGSTTSYLSLMAFGIGSAVSRFIIKARTQGGKDAEERMFGLFNLLFQAIALLTLIVGGMITWKLDLLYGESLTAAELSRMRVLVGLMVINTAVNLSATSYHSVVFSHERFLFVHSVNILSTIGAPVLNLVILFMGYRSVGMAVVSLTLNVLVRLMYLAYVRRALDIRPRYKGMPSGAIREIFAFSFWVFVSNIVGQIYSATDTVIIGAIPELATVGAAIYSIGSTFTGILFSLAQVMPTFFAPKVNQMTFSGCTDAELTNLVISVGRIQGCLVALVCSGFIAFGMPFITCYVGAGYEESYWVAVLVMIPNCIPLVQSVAHSILQAKNMHQFRSKVYLAVALLNIVGTLLLVRKFGVVGAAIPTGVSYLLGHGLIMNWYYWKKVKLDIPRFWKEVLPIFGIAAALCTATVILSNWVDLYSWLRLAIGILCYTAVYALCTWSAVMNEEEKTYLRNSFKINRRKKQ